MTQNMNLQLFDMIAKSDGLTIIIYLILVVYSIWSWSIIFDKIFKFTSLQNWKYMV